MNYLHAQDNQEFEIEENIGLNFACCDCALVHEMKVRQDNGKLFVSFRRDNRRTGILRHHHGVPAFDELEYRQINRKKPK